MSKDWDSLSRSEKKEEAQKTLHMLKRQKTKMKNKKNEILGTCMCFGLLFGIVFGRVFEIKQGLGIALGMLGGIIISSIIAKSKANGSEQAEEDGKLLKDKEENKVEEDE